MKIGTLLYIFLDDSFSVSEETAIYSQIMYFIYRIFPHL